MLAPAPCPSDAAARIHAVHQLYTQLTGQSLSLRYDRERMWWDLLHAGYTPQDVRSVIRYLQREIRAGRRNVGALKLSNLLQLDRFEEDLQISRVRLTPLPPPPPPPPVPPPAPPSDPAERQRRHQQTLDYLRQLRASLR
jgi:hypothetical protein